MTQSELLAADRRRIGEIGAALGIFEDPETTGDDAGWTKYADRVVTEATIAAIRLWEERRG